MARTRLAAQTAPRTRLARWVAAANWRRRSSVQEGRAGITLGASVARSAVVRSRSPAMASRSAQQLAHSARWLSISTAWARLSAWSRYAWSSSSGMCRIVHLSRRLAFMYGHEALPRPGQGGPHRADGEVRLGRDLGVAQARIPEEEDLPVAGGQSIEGPVDRGHSFILLHRFLRVGFRRRQDDRVGGEEGQVLLPPHRRPGLVARQVGRPRQ